MARLFFAFEKILEKPANHAPIALRNNARRNQNNFSYQMRCRATDTGTGISTDS
jgi:hypothetical protein